MDQNKSRNNNKSSKTYLYLWDCMYVLYVLYRQYDSDLILWEEEPIFLGLTLHISHSFILGIHLLFAILWLFSFHFHRNCNFKWSSPCTDDNVWLTTVTLINYELDMHLFYLFLLFICGYSAMEKGIESLGQTLIF